MDAVRIFENVQVILRQIRDFPGILDELSSKQRLELDGVVRKLGKEIESAADEEALKIAVDLFLTKIENTLAFINLFMPGASKENVKVLQAQRKIPLNQSVGDKEFTHWKPIMENSVREYPYQKVDEQDSDEDQDKNDN